MSTPHDDPQQPEPDDVMQSEPDGRAGERPLPAAEELARIAVPATLRHAPRYRAFVITGIAVGLLVALVLVLIGALRSQADTDAGSGVVLVFVAGVLGLTGAAVGAAVAVLADRRSRR